MDGFWPRIDEGKERGDWMLKSLKLSFVLLLFILLSGCSNIAKYDNDEPAAIVKGQEITVGDLRFLFPDKKVLDYLDGAIKLELVKQEVKKLDLDISAHLDPEDNGFAVLPPADTEDPNGRQLREYAESQAKKLHMEPEEFQRQYARRINEQNAYMMTYLEEKLGPYHYEEGETVDFNEEANQLLEDLAEGNQVEIEVLIK
ncbi:MULTISPECIES: hypothetical protein [unclassified Sporosarcina]|uniref:hypothetical protein n=1 Tax=unclassified Sporosarcina TaxID=2647733 RepID=UPI00204073D9|nr:MULTISPECIES: hypothetical protein [unclassified Sporosarcina]GKV65144.1 hypothetical protein NCCP2331_12970 [Sporosarcina sp. NCCP-2331]GLB55268.1 hypothetical protein NCCP2378_10540 [Sporosarcina sp. NCCP-2378]